MQKQFYDYFYNDICAVVMTFLKGIFEALKSLKSGSQAQMCMCVCVRARARVCVNEWLVPRLSVMVPFCVYV